MRSDLKANNSRMGIHYFPDTYHYRERDLHRWLPEIQSMGFRWITLTAEPDRVIPEYFVKGLIASGVTPIIKLIIPIQPDTDEFRLNLDFEIYAKWGVKYVCVFDRPNMKSSWKSTQWIQNDLIEHFLDIYLPIAKEMVNNDLTPVLPPLEPGGDYWDTSFLRLTLQGLERRGFMALLDRVVVGAYAWLNERPINWGHGGPESWPGASPYNTPETSHNQIGFRIFDWYSTICESELSTDFQIFVLAGGVNTSLRKQTKQNNTLLHAEKNVNIARLLIGENSASNSRNSIKIPEAITNFNFWLLSSSEASPHIHDAWIKPDGNQLPVVNAFRQIMTSNQANMNHHKKIHSSANSANNTHPIDHYLLLPLFSWGVADWDLSAIRPYIQRYQPTVGFSFEEAALSKRVTIAGKLTSIPEEQLKMLKQAGCAIDQIECDGTILAI